MRDMKLTFEKIKKSKRVASVLKCQINLKFLVNLTAYLLTGCS